MANLESGWPFSILRESYHQQLIFILHKPELRLCYLHKFGAASCIQHLVQAIVLCKVSQKPSKRLTIGAITNQPVVGAATINLGAN